VADLDLHEIYKLMLLKIKDLRPKIAEIFAISGVRNYPLPLFKIFEYTTVFMVL
jgi:hypothetical protein